MEKKSIEKRIAVICILFTWYGLEEGIVNEIRMFAQEGSLPRICQNQSRIDHCAHAHLYGPNCEVTDIRK